MEGVRAVVHRQSVGLAIQGELAFGDAVAVAADHRPEIRSLLQVTIQVVVAQHDIAEFSVAIGHLERNDDSAIIHNAGFRSLAVAQSEQVDLAAIRQLAEGLGCHVIRRCRFEARAPGQEHYSCQRRHQAFPIVRCLHRSVLLFVSRFS
ncbi:hypothetical protein SDC9_149000 [bioreactor metagenome]|uniref:Uncharacterized protein n=1 Tax=bioreactor metagenome TaxID=1076179 RepID=A0A645EIF0_9ZZZZ